MVSQPVDREFFINNFFIYLPILWCHMFKCYYSKVFLFFLKSVVSFEETILRIF